MEKPAGRNVEAQSGSRMIVEGKRMPTNAGARHRGMSAETAGAGQGGPRTFRWPGQRDREVLRPTRDGRIGYSCGGSVVAPRR